jgi:Uncharacterized protein conserved in bacteria
MTINQIKDDLKTHVGKKVVINCNLGRNKFEKYSVVIKELYDYIFLVEEEKNSNVKSFSYTDVITKTIKIDY